jgi:hypothetical protein
VNLPRYFLLFLCAAWVGGISFAQTPASTPKATPETLNYGNNRMLNGSCENVAKFTAAYLRKHGISSSQPGPCLNGCTFGYSSASSRENVTDAKGNIVAAKSALEKYGRFSDDEAYKKQRKTPKGH